MRRRPYAQGPEDGGVIVALDGVERLHAGTERPPLVVLSDHLAQVREEKRILRATGIKVLTRSS